MTHAPANRPSSEPHRPGELRFALPGTLVFLALGLPRVLLHEMWRDECGPWLFAASPSLGGLLSDTAYEGHPWLWFVVVWLVRRAVDHPVAMQIFHLLIATGSVFVLLRFGPWSRPVRLLLAGGYFLFFEYAVLARNYALGVLFLYLFCALAGARERPRSTGRFAAVGALLFLLAQTSVFGAILALAGVVWLAADRLVANRLRTDPTTAPAPGWKPGLAAALAVAGVALAALDTAPPPDSAFSAGWRWSLDPPTLWQSLGTLERAYLPFPDPGRFFWDTTLLDPRVGVRAGLAAALALAFAWVLRRRPAALAFWLAATSGTLAFFYLKHPGHLRHHGHLFLALVAALWLAARERSGESEARSATVGTALLVPLLLVHGAAGVYASWMDLRLPFSSSFEAARFAEERGLDRLPLAGHPDHPSSCVAMWLDREMYYPRGDRVGTWVRWDRERMPPPSEGEALARVRRRAVELGEPVLLFAGFVLPSPPPGVEELHRTAPGIVHEVWAIYRVSPSAAEAP